MSPPAATSDPARAPTRCGYERQHAPETLQVAITITYTTALDAEDSLQPAWRAEVRLIASNHSPRTARRVFDGEGAHRTRAVHNAITRALHSLLGDSP